MTKTNRQILLAILALASSYVSVAQNPRLNLNRANKLYKEGKYTEAEKLYRSGQKEHQYNKAATFALGNTLYRQKKYHDAEEAYKQVASDSTLSTKQRSEAYHNLGNIAMKQRQYEQAIDAYKQALINNPTDDDTRYNLVLAQKQLQKQQNNNKDNKQDQKNQQKQQQNENKQDNKKNKDEKKIKINKINKATIKEAINKHLPNQMLSVRSKQNNYSTLTSKVMSKQECE